MADNTDRFPAALAEWCNGGGWETHYTEKQKDVWRGRAEVVRKFPDRVNPTWFPYPAGGRT